MRNQKVKKTIYLSKSDIERAQDILNGKVDDPEPIGRTKGVFGRLTVRFNDFIEADIYIVESKGYDGEERYFFVDAILFDNGIEVCVLDPSDDILGEYNFFHPGNDVQYQLIIEECKPHPCRIG